MPKLLAATKITPLDQFLLNNEELQSRGFEVVIPSFENIFDLTGKAAEEAGGKGYPTSPPVIVISSMTSGKGSASASESLYGLRALGYRVVLLPGDPSEESTKTLVSDAVKMGIYDFIFDPYTGDNVVFRLLNPATLADVHLPEEDMEDRHENEEENNGAGVTGPGIVKRLADKVVEYVPSTLANSTATKRRDGKLICVLGLCDTRIEEWVKSNYFDRLSVHNTADPEEFRQRVSDLQPDICILMRENVSGGMPDADHLAIWAIDCIQNILLLVGELDQLGEDMKNRAQMAGVRHIISCERGGQLSGDEFHWAITSIIRELEEAEQKAEETRDSISSETKKTINALFSGARKALKPKDISSPSRDQKERVNKKSVKPRINRAKGISLDEEPQAEINSNQALKNPTMIVPGGVLAIVSPWKPNLSGRISAQAVRVFQEVDGGEVVYIGATSKSTGAVWLEVPDEELMMSDWRVPGSSYPIKQGNVKLYAVDPSKDLRPNSDNELWTILKEARKTASYTVFDLGDDMALAQKVAHQGRAVILVIVPGNDPVEQKIAVMWLKNLMDGKKNIVIGIDLRGVPGGIPDEPKPIVIIRNNPADALTMALRRNNNNEFFWN
ncbi:MAG: hypothetical protein ACYDEQ_05520 [Desulfocucumaceae bacterium]